VAVQFEDYSMQVTDAMDAAVVAWLHEAAGEIEATAKRTAAKDTGNTRNSYQYKVNESEQTAYVGSNLENAIWEEFGTGEHALNGNGRQSAWYIPVERVTGKKKPTFQGEVVIVHGKDGQEFYKTDGKKPKRTLLKAFEKNQSKLRKRLENLLKGLN
jgi:hypothetical protein